MFSAMTEAGAGGSVNTRNVRFGSKADLNSVTQLRLLSGVKQTPNVRFLSPKRSCAANVRFWG